MWVTNDGCQINKVQNVAWCQQWKNPQQLAQACIFFLICRIVAT